MNDEKALKEIGEELRIIRNHSRLTIAQAAELAGISSKYWCSIEHGRANITLEVADRISRALKINPLEWLKYYWAAEGRHDLQLHYKKCSCEMRCCEEKNNKVYINRQR